MNALPEKDQANRDGRPAQSAASPLSLTTSTNSLPPDAAAPKGDVVPPLPLGFCDPYSVG